MRQNDLSFANFILRFGLEEVLLDHAEDILIPAFTNNANVRSYGDTNFRFYDVHFRKIDEEDGVPTLALSGHFVKDTVLRRQQIFRRDRGLVEDEAEIESAPSSFFVLILNNHRLLYFAETASAPPLEAFETTALYFIKLEYRNYLRRRQDHANVTRRGVDRLTLDQLRRQIPPPRLAVVPVAGQDLITETIQRFKLIKQVRFKLVEPNDEIDASKAVAAIEKAFRPMQPRRLEILAGDPKGLDKAETARAIGEASEGHNTEIIVDGVDHAGLKLKADNDEFALSVPIEDPPASDAGLAAKLVQTYKDLVAAGKVKKLPTPANVVEKIARLAGLL